MSFVVVCVTSPPPLVIYSRVNKQIHPRCGRSAGAVLGSDGVFTAREEDSCAVRASPLKTE